MRRFQLIIPLAVALGASAAPFVPAQAQFSVDVAVTVAPPELPVYEQPPLPAPGYIFQPGYWAYGDAGYFWVPATWVEPPQPGLLWTPGYWGWNGGRYLFNAGYWGATVGYYGGINYGFGYGGFGYEGGYWRGGVFNYNSAVNRFGGVHVTNVYVRNVTNVTVNRVSFNGPGGVTRRPEGAELAAARENHIPPTASQMQQVQAARQNRELLASVNHGRPAITATPRAGAIPAAARGPEGNPSAGRPNGATGGAPGPHPVAGRNGTTQGAPGPHPVNRATMQRQTPGAAPRQSMAPNRAAPESRAPESRGMEPRGTESRAPEPRATRAPESRPSEPRAEAPRPMAEPRQAAEPRAMAQPRHMAAPHANAAPRPAPAARPAPGQHDDKPRR
jgi:hypothetical protein